MSNWYYIVGQEKKGPVQIEVIQELYSNNAINSETYVWKKGFQNWERFKDVSEIQIQRDKNSPEVKFNFQWKNIKETEELFFIKIGNDRQGMAQTENLGPYSKLELKEALKEKRINFQTLIYSPGMASWVRIEETPINENLDDLEKIVSLEEKPLLLVFDYSPIPLITLAKKIGSEEGVLLGAGPFLEFQDELVSTSLYVGNELKAKNIKLKVQSYDKKNQTIECLFMDLHSDVKKIFLNHGI